MPRSAPSPSPSSSASRSPAPFTTTSSPTAKKTDSRTGPPAPPSSSTWWTPAPTPSCAPSPSPPVPATTSCLTSPPGSYRIIVTNTAVAITASAPSPWLFRGPVTGERPVTLTITDYRNQDFGLYKGRPVSGVVFLDNGAGGATANNGRKTGGEPGIPGVTVRLLTAALVELDRVETAADGTFVLYVPDTIADNAGLIVEEINPANHLSTGGFRGTPASGTYTRTTDRLAYNHSTATARTGIEFGDVPNNALLTDGSQTVLSPAPPPSTGTPSPPAPAAPSPSPCPSPSPPPACLGLKSSSAM